MNIILWVTETMHRFDEAVRLVSTERRFDASETGVCVDLMREYLRREALWAKKLGLSEELPFANLPGGIDSHADYVAGHRDVIESFVRSSVERRCCVSMINWYGLLRDVPASIEVHALPDPYLPLMRFFETGGFFTTEHRVNVDVNRKTGVHAGIVQHGNLDTPFVVLDE